MFICKNLIPFKEKNCIKQYCQHKTVVTWHICRHKHCKWIFFHLMARYFHWNTVSALLQDRAGTEQKLFVHAFQGWTSDTSHLKMYCFSDNGLRQECFYLATTRKHTLVLYFHSSVLCLLLVILWRMCITADVFQFYSKNTDTHTDPTETGQNLEI